MVRGRPFVKTPVGLPANCNPGQWFKLPSGKVCRYTGLDKNGNHTYVERVNRRPLSMVAFRLGCDKPREEVLAKIKVRQLEFEFAS